MTDAPIIEVDTIDSTNNYAMQLIDANKARHGLTIVARSQTAGKGQRGKTWTDQPGESLLMSVVVVPSHDLTAQFIFNASVVTAIANFLQNIYDKWNIRIKWPNDIIINDKKAGGILIENVLRGTRWLYSVIGVGINIRQDHFPPELPFATSLKIESSNAYDVTLVMEGMRSAIIVSLSGPASPGAIMERYNELLYRKEQNQRFSDRSGLWEATIVRALPDGSIELRLENGSISNYRYGEVQWEWL